MPIIYWWKHWNFLHLICSMLKTTFIWEKLSWTIKTGYKLFREKFWNCPPKRLNTHAVKKTKHEIISHASIKFLKGSSWTDPGWRITHPKLRTHIFQKIKVLRRWIGKQNLMNLMMWKLAWASNIFWKNVDPISGKNILKEIDYVIKLIYRALIAFS